MPVYELTASTVEGVAVPLGVVIALAAVGLTIADAVQFAIPKRGGSETQQ